MDFEPHYSPVGARVIVVGVDVGGTSARAVLYDNDDERGRAEGPSRPMRAGEGKPLAEQLGELVRPLLLRTRGVRADALVVGASGAGRDAERDELTAALQQQRLAWRVAVTTDAELARTAAFAGGPGVLLIAGTGSIAIARTADGESVRAGGLGWRMGDRGSAYWIGARALEAVGAVYDGSGMVTRLAESLCAAAHVAGIAALSHWSARAAVSDVASLAPAVMRCADQGDPVAIGLRDDAVAALVQLAAAAGAGPMPVALAGGLLAPERALRARVSTALMARGVEVMAKSIDPCRGAIDIARRL